MKWIISLLFCLLFFDLFGQGQTLNAFYRSIESQYPGYQYVYGHQDLKILSFGFNQDYLILTDAAGMEHLNFFVLDMEDLTMVDTLALHNVLYNSYLDRLFYEMAPEGECVYIRPSGGTLDLGNPKKFFNSASPLFKDDDCLTIKLALTNEGRLVPSYLSDGMPSGNDLYYYFLNRNTLKYSTDRKKRNVQFYIKDELVGSYSVLKEKGKNYITNGAQRRTYFKSSFSTDLGTSYFHPNIIIKKEFILVDVLNERLVQANNTSIRRTEISIPNEVFSQDSFLELIYDAGFNDLYLRSIAMKDDKDHLFRLVGTDFKKLDFDFKSPKAMTSWGGPDYKSMFIHNGKLFTVLPVDYEGDKFNAIFSTILP